MKIVRIQAYRVELPLHETTYKWGGEKSVAVFDSTIVRAGLRELGPYLMGDVLGKAVLEVEME